MYKWRVYLLFSEYLTCKQRMEKAGFTAFIFVDYSKSPPNHWYILAEHENRSAMTMYLLTEAAAAFIRIEEIGDV
jgi:hypothetical protein